MIINSWLLDGQPTEWSAYFTPSAIQAILPLRLHIREPRHARLYVLPVIVADQTILCSREISESEGMEVNLARVREFRREVIKLWGAAQ